MLTCAHGPARKLSPKDSVSCTIERHRRTAVPRIKYPDCHYLIMHLDFTLKCSMLISCNTLLAALQSACCSVWDFKLKGKSWDNAESLRGDEGEGASPKCCNLQSFSNFMHASRVLLCRRFISLSTNPSHGLHLSTSTLYISISAPSTFPYLSPAHIYTYLIPGLHTDSLNANSRYWG